MKEITLWKWFSLFIRLRDSDDNGYCRCISCGRIHYYKEMDAGHYFSRNAKSIKYDETNVNAQCKRCNKWLNGNIANYKIGLERKYDPYVIYNLEMRKNNYLHCFDKTVIKILSDEYREKAKAEAKKRGIEI